MEDKLNGLWDGHEITFDVAVRHCNRPASLDLTAKDRRVWDVANRYEYALDRQLALVARFHMLGHNAGHVVGAGESRWRRQESAERGEGEALHSVASGRARAG